MQKHWDIFIVFRKLWLMRLLEYRQDFFFWSLVGIFWTGFNFLFIEVLSSVRGEIGGWNRYELYLLMSVFTIIDAFLWSFFYHIFQSYTRAIFTGELDMVLLKPVDAQFLLSVQKNSYNNVFRLLIGIAMVFWSLGKLGISLTLISVLTFLLAAIVGLVLIYSVWFMIATGAFYVEKLDNINEIFPALRQVFQMPRSIYTGVLSMIFITIFPLALITSLPTEALLGRMNLTLFLQFLAVTTVFFILSRVFFIHSIKKYSGAGS
jgi:ABC-2 type transport system permease protein